MGRAERLNHAPNRRAQGEVPLAAAPAGAMPIRDAGATRAARDRGRSPAVFGQRLAAGRDRRAMDLVGSHVTLTV